MYSTSYIIRNTGTMSMNMKAPKKMKGFMCHSPSSTAVCMSEDYRSVIIPRRPNVTIGGQVRLVNGTKYIRLGDRHAIPKSFPVSSVKIGQDKKLQEAARTNALANSDYVFQVVVLRVSIHCQGCAGKVKKHLSKMEGVTSFSIDLESKRVTVMGHVLPSAVLESISKVKRAELWPCQ